MKKDKIIMGKYSGDTDKAPYKSISKKIDDIDAKLEEIYGSLEQEEIERVRRDRERKLRKLLD